MVDTTFDPTQLAHAMGHGLYVTDLEGRIVWGNEAGDRITGLDRPATGGCPPPGSWRSLRPDGSTMPPEEWPSSVAIRTGQAVHNQVMGIEVHGSGDRRWVHVSAVPHRDADGSITGAIVSFEDISAQRVVLAHRRRQHRAGRSAARTRRIVVHTLEEAVLPRALPTVAGVGLAAHYLPAASAAALGGDWYDAIPLPDGGLLTAVGDVAGHGLDAVGLMNVLRNAIRVLAALDPDPGSIVAGLRRLVSCQHPDAFATVAVVRYEPASGRLRCVTAGHLPPVVRRAAGSVEQLMATASGPALGVRSATHDRATHTVLEPGDALVLFTDGLIERRSESLDLGYRRLARDLEQASPEAHGIADAAIQQLRSDDNSDDVCVLVLQRHTAEPCVARLVSARSAADTGR